MHYAHHILATRLWWRHAYLKAEVGSQRAFIRRFDDFGTAEGGEGLDARSLRAWQNGRSAVSRRSVQRVEIRIPGTEVVYAIGRLLSPARMSAPGARRLLSTLMTVAPNGSQSQWWLPAPAPVVHLDKKGARTTCAWGDSNCLAARKDFLGLLAILVLVREAMAQPTSEGAYERYRHHLSSLYAALPDVLRVSWVREDADLLLQCLEDLRDKPFLYVLCRPTIRWSTFRARVLSHEDENVGAPWVGEPRLMVVDAFTNPEFVRPVPLLPDAHPLQPYVRPSIPVESMPKPTRKRRQLLPDLLDLLCAPQDGRCQSSVQGRRGR